jgi:FKBP-type peptidyl-prolyl cis-trans isomerase 2
MEEARSGDLVQVHFTGRLEDGSMFGTTRGKEPAEFVVGGPGMLEGISRALEGMRAGESTTLTLTPEQGFGPRDPDLESRVPRAAVPAHAHVGDQLVARGIEGAEHVWVRHLGDDFAILDGNHPLAGLTLTFDLELVSVQSAGTP